jgi:hypothetical protein
LQPAAAAVSAGTTLRRLLCRSIGLKIPVNVAVPADCLAARAELYAKTLGKFVQDLQVADYNKFGYVYAQGRFSGGIGFESRRLLGQFNALSVHPQTLQSSPPYLGSLKRYYMVLVEASQANDHSKEAKVDKAIWDSIAEVLKMQNHAQRTLLVCQLKIVQFNSIQFNSIQTNETTAAMASTVDLGLQSLPVVGPMLMTTALPRSWQSPIMNFGANGSRYSPSSST